MTRRHASRSAAILALAMGVAAAAGCARDRSPRRVPDDGAPCSAVMPGVPKSGEEAIRLGTVAVTERSWGLLHPNVSVDPPKDITSYVVRRGTVPAGSALQGAALLDAAAARAARGVALQNEKKATIAKVATDGGEAVELRWMTGRFHNATRLLLIPGGYCEVTILGAYTDADIASYLGSVVARP